MMHIAAMKARLLALAAVSTLFVSCVPPELTGDTYGRHEAGQAQTVRMGRVTDVRYVKLEGNSQAGPLVGAITGGIVGNQMGGGRGNTLATLAGVGAGAVIGSAAEKGMTERQGIELTVRLDDGEVLAVTQEDTPRESFSRGDRVRVLYGSGRVRVSH